VSDEPIRYVSVTALTGLLPLPWMEAYASKHAAECAFNEQDAYRELPSKDERIKFVKGASRRYSRAAAERGTQIHAHVEKRNLGVIMDPWPLPVAASMRQYEHFLATVKPRIEAAECKVYHRRMDLNELPRYYAGTMDLLCEIDGRMAILDAKSGKSIHEDAALQLAAYANADFIVPDPNHPGAVQVTPNRGRRYYTWEGPAADEIPMPEVKDGYVLHLRDDGWQLVHVPLTDELYEMFLSLFSVERWERDLKKRVFGTKIKGESVAEHKEAA
jgi:hypothetical protein